ncbi:hypothetical protein TPB0596_12200 [Tsukamurella pulmonis]|uniref:hypothetical protein n=1 Tax=Tsukamurella pulmonis TaxID=47312 RepID=UPI001EDEA542|nr:hypothetical protein [Tsukamurella pulmonis]BDD81457.1 hypothetical protein TPB0596_12200 [Tsukamurella pulmonis]
MPEPTRWRKKPVEIEAMQWTGDNAADLAQWTDGAFHDKPCGVDTTGATGCLYVAANRAHLGIPTGEWVIHDRAGFYPCRADVFADTYEPAEETVRIIDGAGQLVHEHPVPAAPDEDDEGPEYPETLAVAQLIYTRMDSESNTTPTPWGDLDEEQRAPYIEHARNLGRYLPAQYPKLAAEHARYCAENGLDR